MGKYIKYRGRHKCPLLYIGKYIAWLTSSISFGKIHNAGYNAYYLGWLIVTVKIKFHHDFVERINAGTWPKRKLWIIKYGK
ncbi:hypothetical protein LCGC14_1567050 [marine sediment metagenome]|uniref:Uncharacterized protein n=1 Tax=marine sediment metagenome TaxID=412755 RepID=A0A0F9IKR5_9ZZZZ